LEIIDLIIKYWGWFTLLLGGVVGFAYWLFKLFSDKWLTAKFSERLADYKHAQQKELEDVRFEINKLMDRTVKLHQREFEALPEVWSRLVDAHGLSVGVLSVFQQYPDLARMNEVQLNGFLADSPLKEYQKEELKLADDKNKYYQDAINWHRFFELRKSCQEYHQHRLKYGIFVLPGIHGKFEYMEHLLWGAIVEHHFYLQDPLIPVLTNQHP